ncbi:MAG TPA: hypothetical protein VE818_03345 [Nitrososphaeraceae archaeon]|nr:hypothetical protein [Nitrososphaeraceae archaeon]
MNSFGKLRLSEILKLIEYIPITGSLPNNGKFAENTTIDSEFYFESIQRNGSFRDIVRFINKELAKEEEQYWKMKNNILLLEAAEQRYTQLREIGCSYPIEYILFDFCLAVLDGDYLDAGLYLAHSFHILGLSKSFNLLLSVIVNEQLAFCKDVRELVILLARSIEPRNAEKYIDIFGSGFRKRYKMYKEEEQELRKKIK